MRLLVAFALTFLLGFECQLRGSPAGDRTFSLIGISTALIGVLSVHGAPNALAGAVTGIGFIGAGLTFRQTIAEQEIVRGVTTAAAILAAIGAGDGHMVIATVTTAWALLSLEWHHIPGLRLLDARHWQGRCATDASGLTLAAPDGDAVAASGPGTAGRRTATGTWCGPPEAVGSLRVGACLALAAALCRWVRRKPFPLISLRIPGFPCPGASGRRWRGSRGSRPGMHRSWTARTLPWLPTEWCPGLLVRYRRTAQYLRKRIHDGGGQHA